ncbi:helix-turn-helix transcriptional regulator [Vibrio splendidus]|uniref:helix-turn-helix transcriptional regulator n=1 Tax=Vibrio splendidus TaxID=29497 RepID=UPI0038B2A41A
MYALRGRRRFAHPIQMGTKSVKWRLQDIEAWMKQKICERTRYKLRLGKPKP